MKDFMCEVLQRGISAVNKIVLTWMYSLISTWSGVSSKYPIVTLHHSAKCSAMLFWRNGICRRPRRAAHGRVSEQRLRSRPLTPGIEREKKPKTFYPWQISFCFLKGRACYFITRWTEKPGLLPPYIAFNCEVILHAERDRTNIIIISRQFLPFCSTSLYKNNHTPDHIKD